MAASQRRCPCCDVERKHSINLYNPRQCAITRSSVSNAWHVAKTVAIICKTKIYAKYSAIFSHFFYTLFLSINHTNMQNVANYDSHKQDIWHNFISSLPVFVFVYNHTMRKYKLAFWPTLGGPKNDQLFCQNFVKSPPNLITFGTKIAKTIEICKIYALSTSYNLCQRITV